MSSMRTKYAPLVPSSILLDKRWKEHDYLLHLYRLRALRGDHVLRPNLNNIYGNPSKKVRDVQSAKLNSTTQTVYLTNNNVISKRPHTAKYDLTDDFDVPPLKQRWIKSSTGSRQSNHKANVQESSNSETHLNFEKKSLWADSNFTDSRVIPIKQYELNEKKDEHSFSERPRKQFQSIYQLTNQKDLFNERSTSSYSFVNAFNSQLNSKKKTITAKYDLNGHLINRKPNAVISKLRPVKSDYSVASMKKHFEKQQYIRNVIHRNGFLHNSKQVQSKLNQKYKDDYSDVFESEVDEISLLSSSSSSMEKIPQIKSLPPSPSPEPPSRELTPLYIEPRFASMRTPTPPAMVLNKRPTPPVFVPPSHIIKIVKDAEFMDSDSELSPDTDKDSNFVVFAKEGQPGMFKRTDSGKVVKVKSIFNKHKKRRTRRSSKNFEGSSKLKDIVYIKYNTDDSTTSEEDNSKDRKLSSRKQSFLLSKQHSFEVQSNEQPSFLAFKQHSFEIQTSDEISEASSESEDVQSENENTQKLKRKTQISRLSNNEIDSNDDKEIKVSNEIHKNELNGRKMSFYAIEAQDDILNSQVEFDAKLIHESGSDVDEFGRRGTRDRPSSSIYHNLPPLHPDIVLDDDDVNKCKVRLMRNTVNIHEALAKNRYCDLEEVCEIIIMNNNDNRRWLRKMYRDEYLQSLLVDLRKSLPANVAGVISNMMIPACEYDAMCLWDALKGMHKDPEVVIEILITRSNEELEKIRKVYELRYNEELLDHIEDETTGVFQKILMKLATGQRDNQYEWTKEDAAKEARALSALLDAGGDYLDKKIRDVFCRYPFPLLHAILIEYTKFRDHDIELDIVKMLKGNFCRCVLAIIQFIQNPPNYFVQKIHKSHYGAVDDDRTLCRIIVSRAENDLAMIKQLFFLRFGIEMFDYIAQVCHSPIKGLVLRLIANLFSYEEKEKRKSEIMPPFWIEDGSITLDQRLSFPDVIKIILQKTKIVNKFVKILIAKRERMRLKENEVETSDSGEETENMKDEESDAENVAADVDSEEEERREAQEAQRQLRDGLKNMSLGENESNSEGDHKSVFQSISFGPASRGILKKVESEAEANENPERIETQDLQNHSSPGHKAGNVNGPVIDPTFISREQRRGLRKPRKFRGTVKGMPMNNFDALKDAQAIGKSMLQKNRNTEKILQFLTSRNNAQRQLIIREFFRRYRRDLVDDIRMLVPQHEDIVLALLLSSQIYDAASIYSALKNEDLTIKIDVLIEILCTRQNDEIAIIKRAFNGIFNLSLQEEIEKITCGHFKKLMCTIVECQRDENDEVDYALANKDSQTLYETILRRPTNHEFFIELFATRSLPHIDLVCDLLSEMMDMDILERLDEVIQGIFLEAITAIICNIRDPPMFFSERIYRSISYLPCNYSMLIRCIVSRSEIDLQIIKAVYRRTYGTSIYSMVDQADDLKSRKILLDIVKK